MTEIVEPFEVHGLKIRPATKADIPALVALHRRNFSPDEFSMMLSPAPTELFYKICIEDPWVSLLVGEDAEIFCFSVVFSRFTEFYSNYQRKSFWVFIKELLKLLKCMDLSSLKRIFKYFLEKPLDNIPEDIYEGHVGSLALDKDVRGRPEHIMCFHSLFTRNVAWLKTESESGFWTTVFENNKVSRRLIKSVLKPDSYFLYRELPKKTLCYIKRLNH